MLHAPVRNVDSQAKPWEGYATGRKPWEFPLALTLPCIAFPALTAQCVTAWRFQTAAPYMILVDTGSLDHELGQLNGLRAGDCEIHSLRFGGRAHPSEFPAIAMDLAFASCQSDILICTHQDVFPRRRDLLHDISKMVSPERPVVGYEMSPREGWEWQGCVSHTLTAYHMPTMHKIGFGWSLQRLRARHGHAMYTPTVPQVGWPDTEVLGNEVLRENGITPYFIGHETNYSRFTDDNIDHFRSFVSSGLWCLPYHNMARQWYEDASREGVERCKQWAYQRAREQALLYRHAQEGSEGLTSNA